MALLVVAAAGACDTLPERRDEVTGEVARFEEALGARRYDQLCAALAPATREDLEQTAGSPCGEAIGGVVEAQELPMGGAVRGVDVYGDQARVVLERDTVFLARFPAGWKVTAAGCRPRPERPYQCELKGG
ncbi:hypothetical protein ACFYOV_16820 [Streptomyces sp. NPDC005931]|uniref:hypothetical protein n=1 Tax=Streptomyces sp. NPDC005931 TaxID=3364737 RepID=UPI0036C7480D